MRILVYGAGPLGSLFAVRLLAGGNEVAILARGARLAALRAHGIVLIDGRTGERTVTPVPVVEQLGPDDAYDLVLVVMRKNQAVRILPALAANRHTPNVLFLLNNGAGPGEWVAALGAARVLIGFPASAGYREGDAVRYLGGSPAHPIAIPIGEVDGGVTARTRAVAAALGTMPGYTVTIRPDMDAWLCTHVALLMPSIAPALYAAGLDQVRLAHTRDARVLLLRALREGFAVLDALGVPITPARLQLLRRLPEPILVALLGRLILRPELDIGLVGHAAAARDEVQYHVAEFRALARHTGVPTPAIDRLTRYLDPGTPLLPDGAAGIPLDWRAAWLVLAGLVGALEGLRLAGAWRQRVAGRPAEPGPDSGPPQPAVRRPAEAPCATPISPEYH